MKFKIAIRAGIGWLFAFLLTISGSVRRARKRVFRKNVITSIAFHNPSKYLFEQTIIWLKKNGYTFISTDELINVFNRKISAPRGAVWISFDDAWKKNIDNVIPLAVRYNVPVMIFVCTDAIKDGTYWWLKVRQAPHVLPAPYRTTQAIRKLPEEKRKQVITSFEKKGLVFPREAMTVEDIKKISAIPQVTLGAHTASHPILSNCNENEIVYELAESKKQVEEWTVKPVKTFAYPNGVYSGKERHFLENLGYELAVTTETNFVTPENDRYFVPRIEIAEKATLAENICHIVGIWQPLIAKLRWINLTGIDKF